MSRSSSGASFSQITTFREFLLLSAAFCFLVLAPFLPLSSSWAASSVNVPLDHWAYSALDKLDGFGLIHSDIQGTRPFSRNEFGRLIQEALIEKERLHMDLPSLPTYLLEKLQREFQRELGSLQSGDGRSADSRIKPLQEVQARYVYSDGEPRRYRGYERGSKGMNATEGTPMVYNNDGITYSQHHNFSLQFSTVADFRDIASAYLEPIFLFREDDGRRGDFDETKADLLRGYGKLAPWNMELLVGRDSLWWGQGRHGDLVLSNNAFPLDMIKLSNPAPIILPWYFSYLGLFKYTFFLSRLEDMLVMSPGSPREPYITDVGFFGYRLNFKPTPTFEMGFCITTMFGGDRQPGLGVKDYLGFFGIGTGANINMNQVAQFDFRFQFPFLRNMELYGTYGGEDSGWEYPEEALLGDIGYMVGIFVPRLTDDGRTDLRVEYTNNSHRVDQTPGVWYGNSVYRGGYVNSGMILGHHMFGDADDLFVRVSRYLRNDLNVGLDYDYMCRGITLNPVQETVHEFGADFTLDFYERMSISARYGFQTVENYNLREGEDRHNHLFTTVFKWDF